MVYNFHGLYIKLWRVMVFSVARMVLFPPVGIFPKIGWCSSSWFGVPRMGFVLFVPDRVVCPHAAVFCSRLLFSLPECSLPWCCHSCTGMTGRWYEIKRDEARWGEMRWTEMNWDELGFGDMEPMVSFDVVSCDGSMSPFPIVETHKA